MLFDKLLNILNMDNWKKKDNNHSLSETTHPQANPTTDSQSAIKLVLLGIRHYWQQHPQSYTTPTIPDARTSEYCLYGKVLMLWAFGKGSPLKSPNDYPVYFYRECRISNPQKLHNNLIKQGYLRFSNIREILASYKVSELKVIADSIGCIKTGKKADLINRILENMTPEDITYYQYNANTYSLSDKGLVFLENNYDYIELHRFRFPISLYEFNSERYIGGQKRHFNDTVFQVLTKRIYNNLQRYYFHGLELDYLALYEVSLSDHIYDIALDSYLRCLYIKTCCINRAQYYIHDFFINNFDYINSEMVFTSQTASPLIDLQHFYSETFVINIYKDASLPPSFLSRNEFCAAVREMLNEEIFDFEKYNNIIRSRLIDFALIELD